MTDKAKVFTVLNLIFSIVLWLLGILTLVFNLLGLWTLWNLTGFGFIFFVPVPVVFSILSFIFSCREKKLLIYNLIFLTVSVCFILFTYFVSTTWFW